MRDIDRSFAKRIPCCGRVCVWNIWTNVKLLHIVSICSRGHAAIMQTHANEAMHDGGSRGWSPWCTCIFVIPVFDRHGTGLSQEPLGRSAIPFDIFSNFVYMEFGFFLLMEHWHRLLWDVRCYMEPHPVTDAIGTLTLSSSRCSVFHLGDLILLLGGLLRLGYHILLHVKGIQFPTDHSNDPVLF